MKRHLVLVGLPGAGKSTVGRRLAKLLPAPLVDIDRVVVRQAGMPIARIFAEQGEARFRELERQAMATALDGPAAVVVPGGGWAAQPGAVAGVRPRGLVVYLQVPLATALARATRSGVRPLLQGDDPEARMQALWAQREPFYRLADVVVDAGARGVRAVAEELAAVARRDAGW